MLMKMKPPHLSNYGIIGSSNFTEPGLCRNVELNLLTTEQHQLNALWDWYEQHWNEAEEVKEELLKVIEPHLTLYSPFDVYAKALYEYFLGKELPATTWEEQQSKLYPMLDELQRRGYRQALKIAAEWGGALICDGVGFGKTYIGLMLIERFLHERKRIALIVPKSARESVWENRLRRFFHYKRGRGFSTQIIVLNHTDLPRDNEDISEDLLSIKEEADVIIVDEAHHFRTPSAQRSEKLFELVDHNNKRKQIFLITATPVNNSLFDLLHLTEYFTGKERAYFQKVGINDTRTHFVRLEKAVEVKIGAARQDGGERIFPDEIVADAERILRDDKLFQQVVIQRSRSYARQFFEQQGGNGFYFPERLPPVVAEYHLAKVYGELFDKIKSAFSREKPFVELALYNPENYRKDKEKIRPDIHNREVQVITLIRATLLKRMESSYKAFEASLEDLLRSMARFFRHYAPLGEWERWKQEHQDFWNTLEQHWRERFMADEEAEEVEEDDILPPPKEHLPAEEFFIDTILASVQRDMEELARFLDFIHNHLTEETDDKLRALVNLLDSPELKGKKLVIFTQYRDTARYLWRQLIERGFERVEELDSTSKKNREEVIKRFSPYYNCTDEELKDYLEKPINILISTDVLSEGLNLQDANLLINYDLHWNPVRLMQRIGRVDRRLDPAIEKKLGREKNIVRFWNFLPPDKLDELLGLYKRVSGKVLRISKTLGIEGKKLLRPEDDYEALRDFNAEFEGIRTADERLHLVLTEILQKHPALAEELPRLPKRLFSGMRRPDQQPSGVFAAYRFPTRKVKDEQGNEREVPGECRWYFHQFGTETVLEDLDAIHAIIQSQPETPRVVERTKDELRKSLKLIEQKKVNPELRNRQALAGEKATLVCWMEVV